MLCSGSASPPVLIRRRDIYRPLRLHRITPSAFRPRPDLSAGSSSRPRPDAASVPTSRSVSRRPITPSDAANGRSFSAQTRTGRSLSSLTSSSLANVPVSRDSVVRSHTGRTVSGSSAVSMPRDTADSAASKLSRTLVKSLSADKAKQSASLKTAAGDTSAQLSVTKSKSTTSVKKQAKLRTEREETKKTTKTSLSAKVSLTR